MPREMIFVDDGSSDSTWRVLRVAARRRGPQVKPIRLSCDIGQAAAMQAGMGAAQDPSRIANKLIAKVTGFALSDDGYGLKVYRAAGRCTYWPMTADSSMPGVDGHELQTAALETRPARLSRDAAVVS